MGRRPSTESRGKNCRKSVTTMDKPLQRFFKIVLQKTIEDKKLSLPLGFVREYGDELYNVATLVVPNGRVWQVRVTKARSGIWFDGAGWNEFIEHYSISDGFLLVFRYKGMSNFSVFVFNKNACEIRYLCTKNDYEPRNVEGRSNSKQLAMFNENREMEVDDELVEIEVLGSTQFPSTSKLASMRRDSYLRHKSMSRPVFGSDHLGVNNKASKVSASAEKRKLQQECYRRNYKGKVCKVEEDASGSDQDYMNLSSLECEGESEICTSIKFNASLRKLSREGIIAVEAARKLKPKNPSFLVIMRENNIQNNILIVPSSFASRYLNGVSETIKVVASDGREWLIQSIWCWRGGSLSLRGGWEKFFKDNCLWDGDGVCLFELVLLKNDNVTLKASIFHV